VSELAYVTTHFDLPWSPHFVADFLRAKCDFTRKMAVLWFWAPFGRGGGLEATYDVYLMLIEKRIVDFLLVLIEVFLLGVTTEALRAKIDWKSAFCNGWVSIRQIFT